MLVRSSPGRRRGEECASRWPTTQPRQQARTARRTCSVGGWPILRGKKRMRAAHFTGLERGGHGLLKPVPSACRDVGAVEPWPTAWGGTHLALAHTTTTPTSPHCAARVLCGRSVDSYGSREEKDAGRALKDSNAVATTFGNPCRRIATVPSRRDLAHSVGRNAHRVGPHHNHANKPALRSARALWAVGR